MTMTWKDWVTLLWWAACIIVLSWGLSHRSFDWFSAFLLVGLIGSMLGFRDVWGKI